MHNFIHFIQLINSQVRTLLGEPAPTIAHREIRPGAGQALHAIMRNHASHWSCLSLISHIMKLQSQHEARCNPFSSSLRLKDDSSGAAASANAFESSKRAERREDDCSSEDSSSDSASSASSSLSSSEIESSDEEADRAAHLSGEDGSILDDDEPLVPLSRAKVARLE